MSSRWDPEVVSDELITLTRRLAERERDLVILAEGNTSELLDDDHIVVKASGARMETVTAKNFVVAEITSLVDLMDNPETTQDDLIRALDAGTPDGVRRRASIETLIHVAIQSLKKTRFVGHTHPTPLVALLSSVHQETAFEAFVYSDEAIVIGTTLYVPYAEPGIDLGRLFLARLRQYFATHQSLPSLILMGNHGIVALSDTVDGVEAITEMAYKGAEVRLKALAAGGTVRLDNDAVASYFDREDMAERRRNLSGT